LIVIAVPEDKAVLVNTEALPVVELAALLVLGEEVVLLGLSVEPQPVSTTAAITAPATKLAVDARAPRGAFKLVDLMLGSGLPT
jgi:hypothetical protein